MDLILLKPGDASLVSEPAETVSVEGISQNTFDGSIKMISMHFGVQQQATAEINDSASATVMPNISHISLVKYCDANSTRLYQACLMSKPVDSENEISRIFVLRDGPDNGEMIHLFTIELTNATVSEIEAHSHPDDMLTETIKLSFTDITWKYGCQNSHGSTLSDVEFLLRVAEDGAFSL